MSELLEESTKQKLVVSTPVEPVEAQGENDAPASEEERADKFAKGNSDIADQSGKDNSDKAEKFGRGNFDTANNSETQKSDSVAVDFDEHIDETPMLQGYDTVSSKPASKTFWSDLFRPRTSGERRHQSIVAASLAASLAVLGFSSIDLQLLTERDVTIDKNFNLTPDSGAKRELLSTARFEDAPNAENVRRTKSDNFSYSGYADNNGNVILPTKYAEVTMFSEGLGAVRPETTTALNGKKFDTGIWAYVDQTGKTVLDMNFTDATPFHKGVAAVAIDHHAKLIDKQGNILASLNGSDAPKRHGELYETIASNGKVGLVDSTGKEVLAPIYDKISTFKPKDWDYNSRNSPLIHGNGDAENAKFFRISFNGLKGVIDASGKVIIEPKYSDIPAYNKGYATFEANGFYGFVSPDGHELVPPKYEFLTAYDTIIAARDQDGKWSALNNKGETLPLKFDGAIGTTHLPWLQNGMAPFIKDSHVGFVDKLGLVRIPALYDFAYGFSSGFAPVLKDGFWHFINKKGVIQNTPPLSNTHGFTGGLAEAGTPGGLYKFLNSNEIDRAKREIESNRQSYENGYKTGDD